MATERAYCLYETVAPAGFTAASIDNPVPIKPGTTAETKITAVNTQKEGPELPLTGAAGTILLIIGGLGVIALAAGARCDPQPPSTKGLTRLKRASATNRRR